MSNSDYNLTNKTALVTGGSHGIGKSIADSLLSYGCNVGFFGRTKSNVNSTKIELQKKYKSKKIFGIQFDILENRNLESLLNEIKSNLGYVDILINNVGGGGRWGDEDILNTKQEVWEQVFYKNFELTRIMTEYFLPSMMSKNWGRIVTITSSQAKESAGRPWFNVAKMSQTVLMKNLSKNKLYASKGITFNSIAPGAIEIEDTGWDSMRTENPEKYAQFIEEHCPIGRLGKPEEVANLVSFICSDLSSLINGASIAIDGGESNSY